MLLMTVFELPSLFIHQLMRNHVSQLQGQWLVSNFCSKLSIFICSKEIHLNIVYSKVGQGKAKEEGKNWCDE